MKCMEAIKKKAKSFVSDLKNRRGDSHIIAVILVVIVVIALAAVFRNQIVDLVNNLLGKATGGGTEF